MSFFLAMFFSNYIYGNYVLNNNKIENQKNLKDNKYIYIKIVSPNFELKYDLSEKEISDRIKKLIIYSGVEKNKKTLFVWPEGALSGKYFFEIKKYKNLIKENFSSNHLIVFGINTLDQKENKFFNSFVVVDNNLNKQFEYNKVKLVPFGEFLPFHNKWENIGLKKITEGFGSFTKGTINNTFSYNGINIVPLICYEIIFPELIQKLAVRKIY